MEFGMNYEIHGFHTNISGSFKGLDGFHPMCGTITHGVVGDLVPTKDRSAQLDHVLCKFADFVKFAGS